MVPERGCTGRAGAVRAGAVHGGMSAAEVKQLEACLGSEELPRHCLHMCEGCPCLAVVTCCAGFL